jgi:signal transduction histidine kinase
MVSLAPRADPAPPVTASVEAGGDLAAQRVIRVLALSIGAGGTLFNLLAYGEIGVDAPALPGWFSFASVAILWSLPVLLSLLSFVAPIRVLRFIGGAYAVVFALTTAFWFPLMVVHPMPGGASPWPLSLIAVPCAMAAEAWAARMTWVYTVVLCFGGGVLRFATQGSSNPSIPLQDTIDLLLVAAIFVAIVQVALRVGRQLDVAAHSARIEAARAARSQTRQQESIRLDALLHDDVIATLLAAGRDTGLGASLLKEQAQTALDRIEILQSHDPRVEPYDQGEVISRLRAAASRLSGGIDFVSDVYGEVVVPVAVVDALTEALGEALRNSLRHAVDVPGRPLVRSVSVTLGRQFVQLDVSDTGQGFNPRRIPDDRFGIAISIRERFAQLPGGSANVETGPDGTTVRVRWDRL